MRLPPRSASLSPCADLRPEGHWRDLHPPPPACPSGAHPERRRTGARPALRHCPDAPRRGPRRGVRDRAARDGARHGARDAPLGAPPREAQRAPHPPRPQRRPGGAAPSPRPPFGVSLFISPTHLLRVSAGGVSARSVFGVHGALPTCEMLMLSFFPHLCRSATRGTSTCPSHTSKGSRSSWRVLPSLPPQSFSLCT